MNPAIETSKYDDKFSLLLRDGSRGRRYMTPAAPPAERIRRWHNRLERLFARQAY
ncbi:hypothetical protein [Thiothrix nivea]|uniref:Uncharacterized protein n=1 Tax=Thiothrix nivea (strain ATCC 35100 / DSM 5205 / JP2) TaxID=870187 RepID=A0A656HC17_THINJ|nr:hypothetical protein [Thiothrix nivea]EIJ33534.1 hypothetical protein Thini_0909 [Thiothrix nivea DSM 5205]